MPRAYASIDIDAPADQVWARIRDFGAFAQWNAGRVVKCEIEGGRQGDQVGAVRSLLVAAGAHLREQLVGHSDSERCYSYEFRTSPFDVDNYRATLRVVPITEGNRSFVEWWAVFDCAREQQSHWREFFASRVFLTGLQALRTHCEQKRLQSQ
jgi:hypothetical protein